MRVLVSGGSGLLGGRLAEFFQRRGHEIVVGTRQAIDTVPWLPGAAVARMDWASSSSLERACRGVDVVLHAAGMNAEDSARDPIAAEAFNGDGTRRLAEIAVAEGVRQFVYFSTAHVYASPLEGTFDESSPLLNPHPYATSHASGERAVLEVQRTRALDAVVIRISNGFGAPMHADVRCWDLLLHDLCRQAVVNRALALRSSGRQQCDFVALEDVARATECVLDARARPGGERLFNVGAGRSITVLHMAEAIAAAAGRMLGVVPPIRTGLPPAGRIPGPLDFRIDRIRRLGWTPVTDARVEIERTIALCQRIWGIAS